MMLKQGLAVSQQACGGCLQFDGDPVQVQASQRTLVTDRLDQRIHSAIKCPHFDLGERSGAGPERLIKLILHR